MASFGRRSFGRRKLDINPKSTSLSILNREWKEQLVGGSGTVGLVSTLKIDGSDARLEVAAKQDTLNFKFKRPLFKVGDF